MNFTLLGYLTVSDWPHRFVGIYEYVLFCTICMLCQHKCMHLLLFVYNWCWWILCMLCKLYVHVYIIFPPLPATLMDRPYHLVRPSHGTTQAWLQEVISYDQLSTGSMCFHKRPHFHSTQSLCTHTYHKNNPLAGLGVFPRSHIQLKQPVFLFFFFVFYVFLGTTMTDGSLLGWAFPCSHIQIKQPETG